MERKKAPNRVSELRSIEEIIKGHERDREFKPLLDQARLRVAIARQIKLAVLMASLV